MKVYVSARAKTRLSEVREIHAELKTMGFTITSDWVDQEIKKPYRDPRNRVYNTKLQEDMLRSAAKTDIFIMLDEPGLRGAYVELGAFLTDCLGDSKNRKAYIVGPMSHEREFIFESPDYVVFADDVNSVYEALKLL